MKFVLTLLLLLAAWSHSAGADTVPKSATADSPTGSDIGRFLFVVETSAATRSLHEANRSALFEMIFTGLNGQMRTGDTFGVWTYNQETFAGDFPMQTWDAQNPMEVASRAAVYLAGRKYGGEARVEGLVSKIRGVSRAVGDVTIFVLSDGSMKFDQLAYSDSINTEYQQRAKERSRAKKPFVTALIARGGKIVGAYVAIAGQPLPIPERPPQVVSAPKSFRPTVLVAPKHSLPAVVPAVPVPAASVTELPVPSVISAARLSAVPETAPEAKAAEIVPPSPPALASSPPPSPTSPEPLTPPLPVRKKVFEFITHTNSSEPRRESVAIDVAGAATNSPPAAGEPTNPPPVVAKAAEPPPVPASPPVLVSPPVPVPAPAPEPPVAHNPVAVAETPVVAKVPIVPVPRPVAEPPPPPGPKPVAIAVAAMFPEPIPVKARESAGTEPEETPPAMSAVAVPIGQGLSAGAQLGIGGGLLAAALFLIVVMLRRARPAPQPSLITRSMERR